MSEFDSTHFPNLFPVRTAKESRNYLRHPNNFVPRCQLLAKLVENGCINTSSKHRHAHVEYDPAAPSNIIGFTNPVYDSCRQCLEQNPGLGTPSFRRSKLLKKS